jgi:hypothetical protein
VAALPLQQQRLEGRQHMLPQQHDAAAAHTSAAASNVLQLQDGNQVAYEVHCAWHADARERT